MKKKIIGALMAGVCMVALTLPTSAVTSYLDVKPGDEYSYWTQKDGGADWSNTFFVTPTIYAGTTTIYGRSYSKDGSVSSGYKALSRNKGEYAYGGTAKAGILYRMQTYGSPATASWHLTGKYTP